MVLFLIKLASGQLSPPCRHRGRASGPVLLGARGPYTIRRPRSRAPRVRGVAGASGLTGPTGLPPVFVRAAGLFRHCGVKQESPGSPRRRLAPFEGSYSRAGPIWLAEARRELHGVASRDTCPCWARGHCCCRLLRRRSCVQDRRLRRFGRAERAAWRGREFAPLADVLGRIGAGVGASRSLEAVLVAYDS